MLFDIVAYDTNVEGVLFYMVSYDTNVEGGALFPLVNDHTAP